MTTLTKPAVANLRKELEAALKLVAQKTGVQFSIGTIRFDAVSARCKIEGVVLSAGGTVTPKLDLKAIALKNKAYLLGSTFDANETYRSDTLGFVKFVGYNGRAIKYPFIVLAGGKRYKLPTASAQRIVSNGAVA
jgi:hypothetical protein